MPPPPSPPPYVPPPYTPPASPPPRVVGAPVPNPPVDMTPHTASGGPVDPAMVGDGETESGPPITHPVWKGLKDWVRNELDLHKAGHSRESREFHNP